MKLYFNQLKSAFEANANPELAVSMKKYMRDQFDYYGIPSPKRKEIVKDIFSSFKLTDKKDFVDFVELCWAQQQREFKYAAMEVSIRQLRKMDPTDIDLFEKLIAKESWWDTVDGLAPHILGSIILKHIELRNFYCLKWIESENFWYQRAAIILQLMFRQQTDFDLLCKLILRRSDSKEFFVRKASGWALRQYSKMDPDSVEQFILKNKISPLAVREGMRLILKKNK